LFEHTVVTYLGYRLVEEAVAVRGLLAIRD